MSALDTLINTAGGGAAAGIGGAIGSEAAYGIGELLGTNKRRANQQIEQQQKLTDIQSQANSKLMNQSYDKQFELWNKTQAEAQVKHLKEAGLNPALIYAKGGAGGSTSGSGSTSVSGATASNETERQIATNQQTAMGLQLQKMNSEIQLNEALTKKNEADAQFTTGAQTEKTSTETKEITSKIENLKADTSLKEEQEKLTEIEQNTAKIANEYNNENNKTLLHTNLQLLKEITAKANIAETTQQSIIELAKLNVKQTATQILLNNSQIELNENEKSLISSKIDEICNSISISNKQININQETLDQALKIEKIRSSSGIIGKELRGLGAMIEGAFLGHTKYYQ